MFPIPKEIKVESYIAENKGGFAIDCEYSVFWIEEYDDKGKIIRRKYTNSCFEREEGDLIWTYEYDDKGRLLIITSNLIEDFIEKHEYEKDNDGNDLEIVSKNNWEEDSYKTEFTYYLRNPEGVLLAKRKLLDDFISLDEEYLYDVNGILSEVIIYGDHTLNKDSSIYAKETDRLKVTEENAGDKTVCTKQSLKGNKKIVETRISFKDTQGNIFPLEYIKEEMGDFPYDEHKEFKYLDDSFEHYVCYEYNSLDFGVQTTEFWAKY